MRLPTVLGRMMTKRAPPQKKKGGAGGWRKGKKRGEKVTDTMQMMLKNLKYLISEITELSFEGPEVGIGIDECTLPLNILPFWGR